MSLRRRRVRLITFGVALAAMSGCGTPGPAGDDDWTDGREARAGTAAEWIRIREGQDRRLESLTSFSSAGTLVITGMDSHGKVVTERANHRLWRIAPDKAAIRLSVAGATGFRLGWNGERWWMLDDRPDPPELAIVDLQKQAGFESVPDTFMAPPILLASIGLQPFPERVPGDFMVAGGRARFTLDSIQWPSGAGRLEIMNRVRVDVSDPQEGPSRIDIINDRGRSIAVATLGRFDAVETLGLPPGAWPRLAHRIEIVPNRSETDRWVATFDRPLARGRISERLFDLEALIERSDPVVLDSTGVSSIPLLDSGIVP